MGKSVFCPPKLPGRFCDPTESTRLWVKWQGQGHGIDDVPTYIVEVKNEYNYKSKAAITFLTRAATIFIKDA
jgi:hypothetical protein